METIYVMGDSHSQTLFDKTHRGTASFNFRGYKSSQNFMKWILLPFVGVPAYGLGDLSTKKMALEFLEKNCPRSSQVWFVFGEIDARYHLQTVVYRDKISISEAVKIVCKKYLDFAEEALQKFQHKISIVGVVPPSRQIAFSGAGGHYQMNPPSTDEQRAIIANELNKVLKEDCSYRGFGFIDIYDDLVSFDGLNNPEMLCGPLENVHYSYIGDFVAEKLQKKGSTIMGLNLSETYYNLKWNKSEELSKKLGEGWRLPTQEELMLIYASPKKKEWSNNVDGGIWQFDETQPIPIHSWYWSSSVWKAMTKWLPGWPGNDQFVWIVNFDNGYTNLGYIETDIINSRFICGTFEDVLTWCFGERK